MDKTGIHHVDSFSITVFIPRKDAEGAESFQIFATRFSGRRIQTRKGGWAHGSPGCSTSCMHGGWLRKSLVRDDGGWRKKAGGCLARWWRPTL